MERRTLVLIYTKKEVHDIIIIIIDLFNVGCYI